MEYYLITFSNTHTAIAAQKYLEGNLTYQVMPTLREISNSCGISLKVTTASCKEIMTCMKQCPIEKGMYKIYMVKGELIQEIV